MKKALMLLTAALLLLGVAACTDTTTTTTASGTTTTTTTRANSLPQFTGLADIAIYVGDEFDPLAGISASDAESGNVTANISVSGTVDTENEGTYTLTYTVTDGQGGVSTATRVVTVLNLQLVFPTGFYNWKFADTELRHTFMAAAEKYLMNNMYAGVPLFANGSFALYSPRLQLPVDNFVAVMGYGTSFGTMSADDSTVLMDNGQPGQAGKYTYRSTLSTNPTTFNHWLYNDSVTAEAMGLYLDALYVYHFNAAKTGYEVVPSMASKAPEPVGSQILDSGVEVSKVWRISLRNDLRWTYPANFNVSSLPAGHEVINATDFVETFKLALQKKWFRAISGGGDFCNKSTGIVKACDFSDGKAAWEDVGIKKIDDLTIEFTFLNQMSNWNVRYWLSSFVMTPINIEMYNALEIDGVNYYGTNHETIAYHGAYKLDYYEADKILRYSKNPNYHNPNEYFYTGYTQVVIRDAAIRFQEFVAGKIEAVALPTAQYDAYKNYPGIRRIPGATTFRLMINGLGTETKQRQQFPDGTWIPEPLLANQNFKSAMFFAVDRKKLAEEVLKTSTTQMYLFSDAYLVDPELGIPYRQTPQGQSVGEGLSPETFGYNQDAAAAFYRLAIQQLIADDVYKKGTAANPTIINLQLNIFTGSEAQILFGEYMKATFEATFKDYANFVYVTVTVVPRDFPGIYYNYMMTGEFDISIGGISGSTLDAASFLDVFTSDNRGGFTLNWGIDTSVAAIPVTYTDPSGVRKLEMWSFDAITSALNGEVYIINGAEVEAPAAKDIVVTPTTVSFTINLFESALYQNITYTLQVWDSSIGTSGDYKDVVGHVNVVPTSANVLITGLTPTYSGNLDYTGEYRVIINYAFKNDATKTDSSVSPYWMQDSLIDKATVVKTETTASVTLVLNSKDGARTVKSVALVNAKGQPVPSATVSVTGLVVTIGALVPNTVYELLVTLDNDMVDGVAFTTNSLATIAAPAATITNTSAVINVTLKTPADEIVRTVTGFTLKLGTVDVSNKVTVDGLVYTATGLIAGKAYTFTVTFSDNSTQAFTVTTLTVLNATLIEMHKGVTITLAKRVASDARTITSAVFTLGGVDVSDKFVRDGLVFTGSNLVVGKSYLLTLTFSDGTVQEVAFKTNPVLKVATPVVTATGATINFTVNPSLDAVVRTIQSFELKTAAGVVVPGAVVRDGLVLTASGLTAATDYVLRVTFSDGSVQEILFKTAAAPAA